MNHIREQIKKNEKEYLDRLFELLRQPSISTQNIGVDDCARLLKKQMEEVDIPTRILETDGSPIVYGEIMKPENTFTLLIYGHYDVQPPEPLDKWTTPPFEPTIRNGKIYARGVGDNKGQLLAHVFAVKTLQDLGIDIPINVKFLFDGEEENASKSLPAFIEKNQELLEADLLYTADGPMDITGSPIIFTGNRGVLYLELTRTGATQDNHAGNKGNIVPNPAAALTRLISTMHSSENEVLIDGFYDHVRPVDDKEQKRLEQLPFDLEKTAETVGYKNLDMTADEYYKNMTLRPSFNVSGLYSGYTEEGIKAIIPSKATAKIDFRLVADQDPDDIYEKVCAHIKKHDPEVEVKHMGSYKPSRTPMSLDVVQKVIQSVKTSHEKEPIVLAAIGAAFPGSLFTETLQMPSVLVPYANADEDNHAPNENMEVELFYKGIETSCRVLLDLSD